MNILLPKNIAPQHACKRGTEGNAEGAVVDGESKAVDRSPEGAVGDGSTFEDMDVLPRLDDAGKEDARSDIGTGELDFQCK